MTQDSYIGTKEQPLSQNRYVYALDNPMKYVDENGRDPKGNSGYDYVGNFVAFFKAHIMDFAFLLAQILMVWWAPMRAFAKTLIGAASQVLLGLVSSGRDLSGLAHALMDRNPAEVLNQLWTFQFDTISVFWNELSFWDKLGFIGISIVNGAADIFSEGVAAEITAELGYVGVGVGLTNLFLDATAGW